MMNRDQVLAALAQWGRDFNMDMIQGTTALFAPLVAVPDEARVTRDIAYGPHPRHRLDIFRPEGTGRAPCVLFVHGGGFVMGDKGAAGAPFQNNIGAWAMGEGFVGATMTYRLAPEAKWPDGRDDVIAAVLHLAEHAEEYLIDPERIFIMGTSAGATHVADVIAAPGDTVGRIAGAVLLSGIYDMEIAERDQFKPAYYGEDQTAWGRASSLPGLVASPLPCLFTLSELDPPDFQKQATRLAAAWVEEKGHWPRILQLVGDNHLSSASQIGSSVDALGPIIASFVRSIASTK